MGTTEDFEVTMERLMEFHNNCYAVVLQYGEYVLVADTKWRKGEGLVTVAYIYQLIETPTVADSFIESPLQLIAESLQSFEDSGHAIAWAIDFLKQ